nr:N-acetylmuramoyl-L-alanine amidase family protein [uncultured Lachnoanaerobaculum sp.]
MKKLFLLTAAFSVIMSFNAFAFTSSNPDVTIKSGDTGRTYTWTSPLGTEITMPVITKDAVISINPGDSQYMETYFYDPSGAINKENSVVMFGYKNSAFAAPTLSLEKATEYSPLTISSYNVGKPVLERSTYKGYTGQDIIIAFYKITGDNSISPVYFTGNYLKEENANKVGYFYVDMGSSANTSSQGWENTDRGWKYKESNGSYVTNTWKQVDGIWYFFDGEGHIATSWRQIDGAWYFFNASGAMLTGWVQSGNDWYYMNPSGAMATGWVQSGNDWYYMSPSGAMLSNTTTADGYRLDASGRWVK